MEWPLAIRIGDHIHHMARTSSRNLEAALPGEWAALIVAIVLFAVLGTGILAFTCLRHERFTARRGAERRRGAPTRTGAEESPAPASASARGGSGP
jgi:hypothetical protein